MLIYIWILIVPAAVSPSITTTISGLNGYGNADGIEFLLRMLPWMFPILLIVGMVWTGVNG